MKNDITAIEDKATENISSQFGLHQVMNGPTHILQSSSSFIKLIFISQSNLIIESGIYLSLHPKPNRQIISGKFNMDILYPPPYFRDA